MSETNSCKHGTCHLLSIIYMCVYKCLTLSCKKISCRVSSGLWISTFCLQVSLPDVRDSIISLMNTMYSVIESQFDPSWNLFIYIFFFRIESHWSLRLWIWKIRVNWEVGLIFMIQFVVGLCIGIKVWDFSLQILNLSLFCCSHVVKVTIKLSNVLVNSRCDLRFGFVGATASVEYWIRSIMCLWYLKSSFLFLITCLEYLSTFYILFAFESQSVSWILDNVLFSI